MYGLAVYVLIPILLDYLVNYTEKNYNTMYQHAFFNRKT